MSERPILFNGEMVGPIDRVNPVPMPIMRADGRLELLREGYHAGVRTFTQRTDVRIDERMTAKQGKAALVELMSGFSFGDFDPQSGNSPSRAVALAAMLGMFGAGLQAPTAKRMNFVYTGPVASGKTTLALLALVPVLGGCCSELLPVQEKVLRRSLEVAALTDRCYLFFDNVFGPVESPAPRDFMEATCWDVRLPGSRSVVTRHKVTTCFLVGDDLAVSAGIARCSLRCTVAAVVADAQAPRFSHAVDERWLGRPQVRSEILSALWAIVRGWDDAGRPKASLQKPGYEEWCDLYGGMVEWAGFGALVAPGGN